MTSTNRRHRTRPATRHPTSRHPPLHGGGRAVKEGKELRKELEYYGVEEEKEMDDGSGNDAAIGDGMGQRGQGARGRAGRGAQRGRERGGGRYGR